MEEDILNAENDPANKNPSDSQKAAMELYKAIDNHINTPVEGLHIFPTQDVYKFENEEIPVSDRLGESMLPSKTTAKNEFSRVETGCLS